MKRAGKLILAMLLTLAALYGVALSVQLLIQGFHFLWFWLEREPSDKSGESCLFAALANWLVAGIGLGISGWLWGTGKRVVGWRLSRREKPIRLNGAGPVIDEFF